MEPLARYFVFRTVKYCIITLYIHGIILARGETIWVNAILYIVFACIAIYCHIAIFDWILVT